MRIRWVQNGTIYTKHPLRNTSAEHTRPLPHESTRRVFHRQVFGLMGAKANRFSLLAIASQLHTTSAT